MNSLHGIVCSCWQEGRRQYGYKGSERLQEVIQSQQTNPSLPGFGGQTWELPRLEAGLRPSHPPSSPCWGTFPWTGAGIERGGAISASSEHSRRSSSIHDLLFVLLIPLPSPRADSWALGSSWQHQAHFSLTPQLESQAPQHCHLENFLHII